MYSEQIKPVDVDKYMNEHGKPTLKKVVSHIRDIDKELDLSREERIAVLHQAIDKSMQDRYYYTQRKDVQKKEQEKEDKLLGTKIEKASKLAEQEKPEEKASKVAEEEEPEPVEEEEEPEQKEKKVKTLADLLK